eukprot:CAMPEP_0182571256 /NCGR_PEP_ID=MMETSP1324-20130603/12837_1 /TAXON_ID=236786 /ORGANISM="Florenciella sp., Strain RCC1587" /LENGTH=485 /DNA_ID=CAMNT_0024785809 /DNA_START=40 /DNA_END=1493 /DNA_ORIENTATION=-
MAGVQRHVLVPHAITVAGIEAEPEMNGTFERNGQCGGRPQWMQPRTRRYIRFIRGRWELYISHHPAGTTFFYSNQTDQSPPSDPDSWCPTMAVGPHERPTLVFDGDGSRDDGPARAPAAVAAEDTAALGAGTAGSSAVGAGGGTEDGALAAVGGGDNPSAPCLTLYANDTCPFVQRVRIVLLEKGLMPSVEERHVDVTGDKAPEFVELYRRVEPNPSRRPAIPLLVYRAPAVAHADRSGGGAAAGSGGGGGCHHGGGVAAEDELVLIESMVIAEYLLDEDLFPSVSKARMLGLGPRDARERAKIALFVDCFDRSVGGVLERVLAATDHDKLYRASESLVEGLMTLDTWLNTHSADADSEGGGLFVFVCGRFTVAEALVAPALQRLVHLPSRLRPELTCDIMAIAKIRFPRLYRWATATLARESVAQTFDIEKTAAVKQRATPLFAAAAAATPADEGHGQRREHGEWAPGTSLEAMLASRVSAVRG